MGPVVGIIAAVQVDLALDLIDSIGDPGATARAAIAGQLVAFDGRTESMRRRTVPRRVDCALCGESPAIRRLDPGAYAPPDRAI
jgi:hypothetical protein